VSRFHRFVGYLLLGAAFLVAVIGGGDLFWLAVYLLFAGVVLTAPKPDTRTMTATIAGHTLQTGDIVVDKHGLSGGWTSAGVPVALGATSSSPTKRSPPPAPTAAGGGTRERR
jgi:hypothetical protein